MCQVWSFLMSNKAFPGWDWGQDPEQQQRMLEAKIAADGGLASVSPPVHVLLVYTTDPAVDGQQRTEVFGALEVTGVASMQYAKEHASTMRGVNWVESFEGDIEAKYYDKYTKAEHAGTPSPRTPETRFGLVGTLRKPAGDVYIRPVAAHRDGGPYSIAMHALRDQNVSVAVEFPELYAFVTANRGRGD